MISPLLANLYLHWFEKQFNRSSGPGVWARAKIVRYADDFVIQAKTIGSKIETWVETTIEGWLGLTINREKTKVVVLDEDDKSFDFLGYTFKCVPSKYNSNRFPVMYHSLKSMTKERDVIRKMTYHKLGMVPVPKLIAYLNRHLKGWANYFNQGYHRNCLRQITFFARQRVIGHLRRRSQRPYRPPKGRSIYDHVHKQLGLVRL